MNEEKKNFEIIKQLTTLREDSTLAKLTNKLTRSCNTLIVYSGLSYFMFIMKAATPYSFLHKIVTSPDSLTLNNDLIPFFFFALQSLLVILAVSSLPRFFKDLKQVGLGLLNKSFYKLVYYNILNQFYLPYRKNRMKSLGDSPFIRGYFYDNEIFKGITHLDFNFKRWVEKNVSKDESIYEILKIQCLDRKEPIYSHLYWTQLIPSKKLSVEQYGRLIDQCPIVTHCDLPLLSNITKDELEDIFVNYTSMDIVRLFKSSFSIRSYIEILNIAIRKPLNLPVYIDMHQLHRDRFKLVKSKALLVDVSSELIAKEV